MWDDPATAADEAAVHEMGRGALAATVTIDSTPVTVMTAHFKSKLISYPRQAGVVSGSRFAPNDEGERLRYAGHAVNLRTAEAMTIRAHLDTILHNPTDPHDGVGREVAVVFAGDLNDEPEAASTQIIKGPGGSEMDLRPRSGFGRPDRGDGYRMWNLSPLLPTGPAGESAFTRVYNGRGELIDHIFASHPPRQPDAAAAGAHRAHRRAAALGG